MTELKYIVCSCSVSKDSSKWGKSDVTETESLSSVGNSLVSNRNGNAVL